MEVVLVPTTHWDREWYRTFQAFRARLVDTVDRVLELLDDDPGYRFLLDGQSILPEDYVEVRPGHREALDRAVRDGRVAIGPWYVQPDSLLPAGETHVRNLLEGRRAGEAFGPVSTVAYTPDSFGHPAQFPQLFAGFGLEAFVYWRGNADEIVDLPAEYAWTAPDGTALLACHLWKGYFNAAGLPEDTDAAVERLRATCEELASRSRNDRVLLLAGSDHQLPETRTGPVCEALAAATGWTVRRGLLEDFVGGLEEAGPAFTGELVGGRIANLLPGVWSTRTYLKLRNRRCEALLGGWVEPWTALAHALGGPDERPALRIAWRTLLENQAHDSICGCSQDAVHDQMLPRYDAVSELGGETLLRALERISGLGPERRTPWSDELDLAVFNPSPHPRTDLVRFPLEPYPPFGSGGETDVRIHPLLRQNLSPKGFTADGEPARLVPSGSTGRVRLVPDQEDWVVEFVAADVPAFGWKRVRLAPSDPTPEIEDDGRRIAAGDVAVEVADDGTLTASFGDQVFPGLGALEDTGDRGDTYDFDPVPWDVATEEPTVLRRRHPGGIEHLSVRRRLTVPALAPDRSVPAEHQRRVVDVITEARVASGVRRVDLSVTVENGADDHRLRMLFPTGGPADRFRAATTFDVAERRTAPRDDGEWRHPAPATFPQQGWVHAGGLTVAAPGLVEAEVTPDGVIAITLVRAVGWLSRLDLKSRPGPAGPSLPTPGAQCRGRTQAWIVLSPDPDPAAARDAELGLGVVPAGAEPLAAAGVPLIALEPPELLLSALKPAEHGEGLLLRVLNPTDDPHEARVRIGIDVARAEAVRLDETPVEEPVELDDGELRFPVPPHALRSVLLA